MSDQESGIATARQNVHFVFLQVPELYMQNDKALHFA